MLLSKAVGAGGRVYATDIQPEMLDLIRKKLECTRTSNVELVLGTAPSDDAAALAHRVPMPLRGESDRLSAQPVRYGLAAHPAVGSRCSLLDPAERVMVTRLDTRRQCRCGSA